MRNETHEENLRHHHAYPENLSILERYYRAIEDDGLNASMDVPTRLAILEKHRLI